MNRWARVGILAVSIVIFGWVGLGHVLGRTANDNAYKSLSVYSEVLQKIQQDYVDEPNMHLVEAGSLHGLLESLDSESSYLTPREYTEFKQKTSAPGTGETGLNLSKRFGYIIVTSVLPDTSADKAGLHGGTIAAIGGPDHDVEVRDLARQLASGFSRRVRAAVVDHDHAKEPGRPRCDQAAHQIRQTIERLADGVAYLRLGRKGSWRFQNLARYHGTRAGSAAAGGIECRPAAVERRAGAIQRRPGTF